MDEKLLKYKDFINESLLGSIATGVKSILTGPKEKIKELVNKMIQVEKEFINKTDELSFNIYLAQSVATNRRVKSPAVNPLLKQKALVNKKALDSFERSRNSQISSLQDQVMRVVKKNVKLGEYYNAEAAKADKTIADYAYNIAKRHRDGAYADSYYSQFSDMEQLRKSMGTAIPTSGGVVDADGELEEISEIGNYKVEKPYSLKWEYFIQYITGRTESELLKWKHDGFSIKLRYLNEYKEIMSEYNNRKKFLSDEKKRYSANAPIYDVEIEEIERGKKAEDNRLDAFKNYMRMKVDYLTRMVKTPTK